MDVAPTIASPSYHRVLVHVICQLLKYKIRAGEVHTRVLEKTSRDRRRAFARIESRGIDNAATLLVVCSRGVL